MTLKECYDETGSPYEESVARLGNEAMLKRFVLKFLNDPSFGELEKALAEKDGETAFRAAHTLKGICLNLGFSELYKVSAELTEELRDKDTAGTDDMFSAVKIQYDRLMDAIKKLD